MMKDKKFILIAIFAILFLLASFIAWKFTDYKDIDSTKFVKKGIKE